MGRRSSPKRDKVVSLLREQIVKGHFQPDSRLPTRAELEQQLDVGWLTIQQSFEELTRDGFVVPRGTLGTFVADNPPCFANYGLVFPAHPGPRARTHWSRFYTVLIEQAELLSRSTNKTMSIYEGVEQHDGQEERQRLWRDAMAQRLAGMITFGTESLTTELQARKKEKPHPHQIPPCVLFQDTPGPLPTVCVDYVGFLDKALAYLKSKGRRRIAIVAYNNLLYLREQFAQLLAKHGQQCPPYWMHILSPWEPEGVCNCVHLLMREQQADRPDGLIIADDHYVEPTIAGLIAAGVQADSDLDIVSFSTFPSPPRALLPVKWLGFDVREILRVCVSNIDAQRRGESVPAKSVLSAVFEEEVSESTQPGFSVDQSVTY